MFFNRNKQQDFPVDRAGLTDGIEEKVAAFVKDWSALQRGERDIRSVVDEAPLQLATDADVALFMQAMEAEASKIEDQIRAIRKERNEAIAAKDAEIAAIHRQIEAAQARVTDQAAQIDRRALARVALLETVGRIDPALDAAKILKDFDVRQEVVRRKFGDAAVDGRSEAYVDDRFDALAAQANVDPFARVVADGLATTAQDGRTAADKAYQDFCEDLRNAHKRTTH